MTRSEHAESIRIAAMKRAREVCLSTGAENELALAAVYAEVLVDMLATERTIGYYHNGTNRQFEMKDPPPEPVT